MQRKFSSSILLLLIFFVFTVAENIYALDSLSVYCGAGLRKPMEEIAELFTDKYGIDITFQFNGSGALLNQIKISGLGDIYIPGDVWFIKQLKSEKYIIKDLPVAYHTPVIVTPFKNPAGIEELSDLAQPGVSLVLGDKNVAIGRVTESIFKKTGSYKQLKNNIVARMPTVNQVALALAMGQAEAGIIWQANYTELADKLRLIRINEKINEIKTIHISVLKYSRHKEIACKFLNFVAGEGKKTFAKYGYRVEEDS